MLTVSLLGRRFRVIAKPDLERELSRMWEVCLIEPVLPPDREIVLDRSFSPRRAEARLEREIAASVGRQSDVVLIRSSVVATSGGEVLGLVGPSREARSHALLSLMQQGWEYVSNQFLAVRAGSSEVLPLPGPVADGQSPSAEGHERLLSPVELGATVAEGPLSLRQLVWLPGDGDGAVPPLASAPSVLDSLRAIFPLLANGFGLPRPLLKLGELLDVVGGLEVGRSTDLGHISTASRTPTRGGHRVPLSRVEPVGPEPTSISPVAFGLMDGHIRPAPYLDAVRVGGEGLLVGRRGIHKLGELGLAVLESIGHESTMSALVDQVVALHGPHDQAHELVEEAVLSMVDAGALGYAGPRPVEPYLADLQSRLAAGGL